MSIHSSTEPLERLLAILGELPPVPEGFEHVAAAADNAILDDLLEDYFAAEDVAA